MNKMRDSYERFFTKGYISKEQFFDFGLKETIYADYDKAVDSWENLKHRIHNNGEVFIRGFGRGGNGTPLFLDLYKTVLGNSNVKEDPSNNAQPTKLIRELTGYSKTKNSRFELIRNYQVSHIFGRTKNVYAFTAPWNIVYTPKIIDPFTGHEAKGEMIEEYTALFQRQSFAKFESLIDDFNKLVTGSQFAHELEKYKSSAQHLGALSRKDRVLFEKAIETEFSPIHL